MRLAKVNKPTKWFTMNYVLLAQYVVFNHTWKWPGWSSTVLILESDNVEKRKNTLWPGAFNDIWKILRTSGEYTFHLMVSHCWIFLETPKNVRHRVVMINSKPVPSSAAIVQSPIKDTNAKLLGIHMVLWLDKEVSINFLSWHMRCFILLKSTSQRH